MITIKPSGGTGQTFTVNQQGGAPGSITLTPASINAPGAGGSGSIQVTASAPSLSWTAASGEPWVTITPASGTGNGSLQYSIAANPSASGRTATVTVTPAQGIPATLNVTQSGGALQLNPSKGTAPATGATGTATIATDDAALQWTASSNQTWLTVTPASGTGSGNLPWAAAANPSSSKRSAFISVTPLNGTPQTLTIEQEGLTGTIVATPSSLALSHQIGTPLATGALVLVRSPGVTLPFSASAATVAGGNWLSVSGGGNTPAVLSVSANPSGLTAGVYNGTVTLTSSNATNSPVSVPVTLTITAAAVISAQPSTLSFGFQQNGPPSAAQTLSLTSSAQPLEFTISEDTSATVAFGFWIWSHSGHNHGKRGPCGPPAGAVYRNDSDHRALRG